LGENTKNPRGLGSNPLSFFFLKEKEKESLLKKNEGKKEKENRKRKERNGECFFGKALL
jgi:hypothetical protein